MQSSPFALMQRRILLAIILLCVVPAALAQAAPATNGDWQTYKYPMDGFAIDGPVQPQFSKMEQPTAAGTAILHNYFMVAGDSALIVSVTNFGSLIAGQNQDVLLQAAKNGVIEKSNGILQAGSEWKLTLSGYPGLEFQMDGEKNGSRYHFFMRIYLVGGHLYQTLVVSPERKPLPDVKRYLDSFRLIPNE